MINIFNTVLYEPLYNTLTFFISIVPGESLGLAVILLTVLVKLVLLPLTHKQSSSQRKIKTIEPEIQKIKKVHKNNKQEQARKTMELYQKHGINPFSGCVSILIQLPVIWALYRIFFKGLESGIDLKLLYFVEPLTNINALAHQIFFKGIEVGLDPELLYSFITVPININTMFLGYFDLLDKSIILAFLAGVTQFFQMKLAMPGASQKPKGSKDGKLSFQEEFTKNMSTQFKYVMPGIVFFFAWSISAAIALYWTVSNVFSIIHELVVKHKAEALIIKEEEYESRKD